MILDTSPGRATNVVLPSLDVRLESWRCPNLTTLHLSSNQIAIIPDAISQLEKLETLDLEKNQIIEIPASLQTLKALKDLDLRRNPLSIPSEILAYKSPEKEDYERPDAQPILEYYFALRDPDETQTLYEAKLLLVGEGGSGKTSLAHKLLNPDYQLKPETEDTSTEGIDILRWEFTGRDGNLRDTYRTNLADNRGLTELQTAIQHELEKLIPNGIPFPNKWLAVRHSLQNDGRNYIDCAEYEATCRRHGITKRPEMCLLSRFLHELGICLHFQNDPILCHRLILKPNWGTTAVYKILDNDRVKQNLGQFSDADLADIWQDEEYDSMRHPLLQLMKEFKVCYEIPRRQGEYIAPHLLSRDSPDYFNTWNGENNLILRYRYKGFMPKGILTRFIVKMHKDYDSLKIIPRIRGQTKTSLPMKLSDSWIKILPSANAFSVLAKREELRRSNNYSIIPFPVLSSPH